MQYSTIDRTPVVNTICLLLLCRLMSIINTKKIEDNALVQARIRLVQKMQCSSRDVYRIDTVNGSRIQSCFVFSFTASDQQSQVLRVVINDSCRCDMLRAHNNKLMSVTIRCLYCNKTFPPLKVFALELKRHPLKLFYLKFGLRFVHDESQIASVGCD